jgi:hypothetical protein
MRNPTPAVPVSSISQTGGILLWIISLTLVGALIIYYPLSAGLLLSVLLPGVVLFFKAEFFEKLKLATLIVGRVLILLTVVSWFPAHLFCLVAVLILQINMVEATVKDFMQKNYFNAVSGALLIATLWPIHFEWNGLFIMSTKPYAILWIMAYTLWNWNFIYLNFNKSISLFHVGVLAAPLLFAAVALNPAYWFAMRSSTLTIAVMGQVAIRDTIFRYFASSRYERVLARVQTQAIQAFFLLIVSVLCGLFYFS